MMHCCPWVFHKSNNGWECWYLYNIEGILVASITKRLSKDGVAHFNCVTEKAIDDSTVSTLEVAQELLLAILDAAIIPSHLISLA